ncbi:MAG: hypothetical protein E7057_02435 [Lentisphaerae bacterium]|nr:hypothetical protein [Lentisphaerota bacterium]
MLAKFIRMRTARSHPRGARTRALNVPRRTSTNIGNRAFFFADCSHSMRRSLFYQANHTESS